VPAVAADIEAMGAHHDHAVVFDGVSADYRRRLIAVIAINAALFVVEMTAGALAGSQALKADALDFFADTVTYGASLWVIGMPLRSRSLVALAKGASLFVMAIWVVGSTIYRAFVMGLPSAEVMGVVALLGLAANVASVILLVRYRDGDANIRSVWICSRNDAIGNVAVMVAALGVWGTMTGWPDLIVAAILGGLFLNSSIKILRQGWHEYRNGHANLEGDAHAH
jgi:Co/Zn/Cd efflux system component